MKCPFTRKIPLSGLCHIEIVNPEVSGLIVNGLERKYWDTNI